MPASRMHDRWLGLRGKLPRALIIGAQKCGTSALAAYLDQHPQCQRAHEKEVDFFGSDLRYARGLDWYAAQWPRRKRLFVVRFEASPQYLWTPSAAERIRARLPKVRLIALVRDPVERALSAWHMYRLQLAGDPHFYDRFVRERYSPAEAAALVPRTEAEVHDFALAVEREAACLARGRSMTWSVLELGLYGPQLRRYADQFPHEQLLVLDSNDLRLRRVATLERVSRFLGLRDWDWGQADLSDVLVGDRHEPMPARVASFLRDFYAESNRMLAATMSSPPKWAQPAVLRRNAA